MNEEMMLIQDAVSRIRTLRKAVEINEGNPEQEILQRELRLAIEAHKALCEEFGLTSSYNTDQ